MEWIICGFFWFLGVISERLFDSTIDKLKRRREGRRLMRFYTELLE